jgi:hypothetical protein
VLRGRVLYGVDGESKNAVKLVCQTQSHGSTDSCGAN